MLIEIVLPLSLAVIMLSLGIGLTLADFRRVLSMPVAVATGLAMQMIGLPLLALGLLQIFPLPSELALGVMILAFCPGGVTSNVLTKFSGGTVALSITLTAIVSLASVITIPLLVSWAATSFLGEGTKIDVTGIAIAMFMITAVPVALGVLVRHFLPAMAKRIEPVLSWIAIVLFAIILVGALAANWSIFLDSVGVLGPLLVTLNICALAIGLLVARGAGLTAGDAKAVAVELGVQNGTLGITVAGLLGAAGLSSYALPAAVYGIVMYLITLPAIALMRRAL